MGSFVPCRANCNYPEREGVVNTANPNTSTTVPQYAPQPHASTSNSSMNTSNRKIYDTYSVEPVGAIPSDAPGTCTGESTPWCKSLHRLIDALKFYAHSYNDKEAILRYCSGASCTLILNDYHHVIECHLSNRSAFHLNYEYELIYNQVTKYLRRSCRDCAILKRHERNTRETEIQFDTEFGFYLDTLDTMHCYFLHCYDLKMRRKCHRIFMEQERLTEMMTMRSSTTANTGTAYTTQSLLPMPSPTKSGPISPLNDIKEMKETSCDDSDRDEHEDAIIHARVHNNSSNTFVREKGLGLGHKAAAAGAHEEEEEDKKEECAESKYEELQSGEMSYDLNLSIIKNNIKHNQQQQEQHEQQAEDKKPKHNKFFTEFHPSNFDDDILASPPPRQQQQQQQRPISTTMHPFGYRYYYWRPFRESEVNDDGPNAGTTKCEWYVPCKYASLKQEILRNDIRALSVHKYQDVSYKTQRLMSTEFIRALRSKHCGEFNHYVQLKSDSAISESHLMSVILYSDLPELAYHLIQTFTKIHARESYEEMKLRNRQYWHWSKLLVECVQLYGRNLDETRNEIYYHAISYTTSLTQFEACFCAPTSMSCFAEVVEHYVNNGGIMLELEKDSECTTLSVFNCAAVSYFPAQDEKLFIFGEKPMKFHSLIMMREYDNYRWFVKSVHAFDCCISGKPLSETERNHLRAVDYDVMYHLMQHYNAQSTFENKFPDYANQLFASFAEHKKCLSIDLKFLRTDYPGFEKLIMSPSCANLLRIDYMTQIFVNCESIVMYNTDNIDAVYCKAMIFMLSRLDNRHDAYAPRRRGAVYISPLKRIKICNVTFNDQILTEHFVRNELQLSNRFRVNASCNVEIESKHRIQFDDAQNAWIKIPEFSNLIIDRDLNLKAAAYGNKEEESHAQTPVDALKNSRRRICRIARKSSPLWQREQRYSHDDEEEQEEEEEKEKGIDKEVVEEEKHASPVKKPSFSRAKLTMTKQPRRLPLQSEGSMTVECSINQSYAL
mmetsp:Transcript_45227/g.75003  ORF Transcript_45227/g.75003 Transcript_45227/m.75003 type:complete len:1006 (+) Transcript_45227:530-3547(+)